jgi:hypothetical protein
MSVGQRVRQPLSECVLDRSGRAALVFLQQPGNWAQQNVLMSVCIACIALDELGFLTDSYGSTVVRACHGAAHAAAVQSLNNDYHATGALLVVGAAWSSRP